MVRIVKVEFLNKNIFYINSDSILEKPLYIKEGTDYILFKEIDTGRRRRETFGTENLTILSLDKKDTLELYTKEKQNTEYVLKDKDAMFKKVISEEVYKGLTEAYQKMYEINFFEGYEVFKDYKVFNHLKIQKNYVERTTEELDKQLRNLNYFREDILTKLYPRELYPYLKMSIFPSDIFDYLVSLYKKQAPNTSNNISNKYGIIDYISYKNQISFTHYEKAYNGEKKKVEIYKSNGRPYAKPRYKEVEDFPSKQVEYVIKKDSFNSKEGTPQELNNYLEEIVNLLNIEEGLQVN